MRVPERSGRTPSTDMQQEGRLGLWKTDRSRAATFCYTGAVQRNIKQHCAWWTVGLWLPRSLTVENKTRRFGIAVSHLERFTEEANEFLSSVVPEGDIGCTTVSLKQNKLEIYRNDEYLTKFKCKNVIWLYTLPRQIYIGDCNIPYIITAFFLSILFSNTWDHEKLETGKLLSQRRFEPGTSHEDLSRFYCCRWHEFAIKAFMPNNLLYFVDSNMHLNNTHR